MYALENESDTTFIIWVPILTWEYIYKPYNQM